MRIQNYKEIKLGGEMFDGIRSIFDTLLQSLFKKMEDNDSYEGTIDLKLSIVIRPEWIPDQGELGGSRKVNIPVIKHKISTQVPVKDEIAGSKETGMALVYDKDLREYVLKHISSDEQMSIYDIEFPDDEGSAAGEETPAEPPTAVPEDIWTGDSEEVGQEVNDGATDDDEFYVEPESDGEFYEDMDYDDPC